MKGKKVRIQLHTPINMEVPEESNKEKPHDETFFGVNGVITEWRDSGVELEGHDFFNERGQKVTLPNCTLFIPFHKIDHILAR